MLGFCHAETADKGGRFVLIAPKDFADQPAVRAACFEAFAFRGTHGWPPALEPPAFREELYAELAAGLELAEKTLEEAVREARGFIEAIDAAAAQ